MKNLTGIICIAFVMLLVSSCATIFSGLKTNVKVTGLQDSAKVYCNGNFEGYSPTKVKVSKNSLKHGSVITIKKEGFEDANVTLVRKAKVSGILADILFTGTLGLIIDFSTNAIYRPYPKKIKYNLDVKKIVSKE